MWLRNYYNAYAAQMSQNVISDGVVTVDGETDSAGCQSSNTPANGGILNPFYGVGTTSYTGGGLLYIGSGRTPATLDDYCLESPIFNTNQSGNLTRILTDDKKVAYVIGVKNSSGSTVKVGEVGVCVFVPHSMITSSASASNSSIVMVERTVLDEPVTIAAGGIATFTYKIEIPKAPE